MQDVTKRRLKTMARRGYFAALIVLCAVVTWNATARARRPSTQTARPPSGKELSCELPKNGARLQVLGKLPEASGLAMSRRPGNLLWAMTDFADPPGTAVA